MRRIVFQHGTQMLWFLYDRTAEGLGWAIGVGIFGAALGALFQYMNNSDPERANDSIEYAATTAGFGFASIGFVGGFVSFWCRGGRQRFFPADQQEGYGALRGHQHENNP
ncbi:membrane protein [Coxiella burnetii]|uniref:Hypothetical membrane associated protein n=1 Tax=Coxiella burnetii (strain RSA 493 / Nine Mile phase I) TaxID=227377 RepID=Q83BG6_COXBU|nr:membrane protein [Coxiella burnetii]NP_820525.1 membrane-associated protein [Coxiella burnetii RSA 493]AAO91039.1 hypothetical membrane associated protein [Coxiella burnetii RSA 493]ABX77770.1 hypothetical protein COXBURSA331_A1725 [Coxiella burnetii RSA 331]AML48555.1 hypothetical protein AUR58_04715 [Coxiella burnetii]AML54547.1 hypothetical protein AYM38_04160 [Coxiella burnetii]ARI66308.1 hypothetical protein B7L74_07930 [Coxiella burnetii]